MLQVLLLNSFCCSWTCVLCGQRRTVVCALV